MATKKSRPATSTSSAKRGHNQTAEPKGKKKARPASASKAAPGAKRASGKSPSGTKASSGSKAGPRWRTNWPATADLAAWFRCGLEKCAAIEPVSEAATTAHCPISALAEVGHPQEALRHVNRYLRILPAKEVVEVVRMAELGAEICVAQGDFDGCEKYLARVVSADKYSTRPCDKGWASKSAHEFRVSNGLIDPADLTDPEERVEAEYKRAYRLQQAAKAQGDSAAAGRHLREMFAAIREPINVNRQRSWYRAVLESAHELGDVKFVREVVESIPKGKRQDLVGYKLFAELGMRAEAIAGATKELKSEFDELVTMSDPNIHFPVMMICSALECLLTLGEKKLVAQWMKKITSSVKQWKCVIEGWTTTAVLTSFVPIIETLEGKEAALELAQFAQSHASKEPRSDFKRGAVSSVMEAIASVSPIDSAIEQARKIRSPSQRRMELAKLLAKAGRFKELREVCSTVANPTEAANIAWWVKFELPGGEVR